MGQGQRQAALTQGEHGHPPAPRHGAASMPAATKPAASLREKAAQHSNHSAGDGPAWWRSPDVFQAATENQAPDQASPLAKGTGLPRLILRRRAACHGLKLSSASSEGVMAGPRPTVLHRNRFHNRLQAGRGGMLRASMDTEGLGGGVDSGTWKTHVAAGYSPASIVHPRLHQSFGRPAQQPHRSQVVLGLPATPAVFAESERLLEYAVKGLGRSQSCRWPSTASSTASSISIPD